MRVLYVTCVGIVGLCSALLVLRALRRATGTRHGMPAAAARGRPSAGDAAPLLRDSGCAVPAGVATLSPVARPETVAGSRFEVNRGSVDRLVAAAELVISTGFGSTSLVQRRFGVDRGEAGMLMDALEERGVVGPARQSRTRDVLVVPDDLPDVVAMMWREVLMGPDTTGETPTTEA